MAAEVAIHVRGQFEGNGMDSISLLREQLAVAHWLLEETVNDVTREQLHWLPPGRANSIGANYAHVVIVEDDIVNAFLRGGASLATTTWAGRIGVSPLPALPSQGLVASLGWHDWARQVQIDVRTLREYAQAVFAATDEYVASLSPQSLTQLIDLSAVGLGQKTLSWLLTEFVMGHAYQHCGEISCLKGFLDLKGYPA